MDKIKVEIKSIEVVVGETKLKLPVEDAKKLMVALTELFGKEIVQVEHIHHHQYDRWYQQPYYWSAQPKTDLYKVTCSNETISMLYKGE